MDKFIMLCYLSAKIFGDLAYMHIFMIIGEVN